MQSFSFAHLSDGALRHALLANEAQSRTSLTLGFAQLAEFDARRLYLPDAYPSVLAWCLGELKLSEDEALKRIRVARTGRDHPSLFPLLEDGRLNPSAVLLLKPYLTVENAEELLLAAAGKTRAEIERLLAERFPKPDVKTEIVPLGPPAGADLLTQPCAQVAPGPPRELVGPPVPRPRARVTPLSPGRSALNMSIGTEFEECLRYAQSLLGHTVPAGDVEQVLLRALWALIGQLQGRKVGAGGRGRARRHHNPDSRYIPTAVRCVVWERDGGRCTFVGENGHRCEATSPLEFDHIQPFARGGEATPSQLRLRCRAHNQYDAEQKYGAEFMRFKLEEAKRRAAERCAKAEARETERTRKAQEREAARVRKAREDEVIPALNAMGWRGERARRAASVTVDMVGATLEERIKRALQAGAPHCTRYSADGRRLT